MPARDLSRWVQNADGTFSRRPPGDTGESEGYSSMTKAELEAELESRDLPKTGNKAELVARLEDDDG